MMTMIWFFVFSPLMKWLGVAGLIAAGGIALYLLTPAWFPGRFRNAAGLVGVGAIGFMVLSSHFFYSGQRHMAQLIAAKDEAAVKRVERSRHDVDQCNDGLDWDTVTGTCAKGVK